MRKGPPCVLIGTLLVVSGCLGGVGGSTPTPGETATPSPDGSPDAGDTPPTPSNWMTEELPDIPSETVGTFTIGNEDDLGGDIAPHTYQIGNDDSESRTVSITVWLDSTVVMNRSVTFQPNSSIQIKAFRAGNYRIVVDPPNASRHVIDDPGRWDCNALTATVELRPDGSIRGSWVQTSAGCQ